MGAVVDWYRTHRCLGFPPVGLALLAHDIPAVHVPIARLLQFTNRKIEKRKSCAMSALPLKADIPEHDRHVR